MRELVVRPKGLVTRPNKYGQYDAGALSTCRNVCMRDKGVISSMPARKSYRADVMSAGYTIRRMFVGATSMLVFGDNAGTWDADWVTAGSKSAVVLLPATYGSPPTMSAGKLHLARMRDRWVFTSDQSPLVLDSEGDQTARLAGLPAPALYRLTGAWSAGAGNGLLDQRTAAWCLVVRRKFSDGYELISEPSAVIVGSNISGAGIIPSFSLLYNLTGHDVQTGDIIELYRTKSVPYGDAPGSTFYLSRTFTADTSVSPQPLTDTTPDETLGDELYSNPGQPVPVIVGVGGTYTNTPPGRAVDAWVFDSRMFYAVTQEASKISTSFASRFGLLTTADERRYGIGTRRFTGTATIGNPTLTGVSDTTGVVAGQRWDITAAGFAKFADGTLVVSKTVNTITFNANALASGVDTYGVIDTIELNGTPLRAGSPKTFLADITFVSFKVTAQAFYTDIAGGSADITVDGFPFAISVPHAYVQTLTVRATNGQNYRPALPELSTGVAQNGSADPRTNRLKWSKPQQPEHCPPQQELTYGAGTHYRGIPTQDCTWLFASDGLYRMSGRSDDYRVDPVDLSLVLAGRNAAANMGSTVYAYTNRGLVKVGPDGQVTEIARDIIGDLIPGADYADTWDTFVTCDEAHREVWLSFRGGSSTQSYVYSEVSGAFVDVVDGEWSALAFAPYLRSLVVGVVDAQPDVHQFEDDASLVRMGGAQLDFQPLTGGGDPFAQKQWMDAELIFEGVSAAPLSIVPRFDGAAGAINVPAPIAALESRARIGVPRSAAIANALRPGFTLASGGTNNRWSLRGLSTRYVRVAEESGKR